MPDNTDELAEKVAKILSGESNRKKKRKKKEPSKFKTFLTDGITAKDYLMLISTSVFFGFLAIALIMVLFSKNIDAIYLELLDMMRPTIMTIVGGVFGVQAVESYSDGRKKKSRYEYGGESKTLSKEEHEEDI